MVVKANQRRNCMNYLEEVIIDHTELYSFTNGFEKRTRNLWQSDFMFYTNNYLSVLKKRLNLVENRISALTAFLLQ